MNASRNHRYWKRVGGPLRLVKDGLLLTLGAFLYTLAAPPYEWTGAAWLALTPLVLVLRDKTPRAAFAIGFLYGMLFGVGITHWAYPAVAAYFPFAFPVDLLMTSLIYVVFVGPYTGLVAVLACVLLHGKKPLCCRVGLPALWVSGEFARASLFSGCSWELLGHTQYRHLSLIQIADTTGVYGLSFLMALSGYVVAETLVALGRGGMAGQWGRALPWPALGFLAAGITLVLLYGAIRLRQYPPPAPASTARPRLPKAVTVALVQGEMPGGRRWQRVHDASTLLTYITLTRQGIAGSQPDLIVWPEFAVGFYLDREPRLRAQLGWLTHRMNASLLLGAPRMEESEMGKRYFNSAYLLSPAGKILDVYDKIRLLPFAEYRPLALPALLHHTPEAPSEFTAGTRATVFSSPKGVFGVLICYEATYPHLARRLVRGGAQFLLNISNDTWIVAGGRAAARQHFSLAVFRAVENKRPLARVATSGISGFVDPVGRLDRLSVQEEGVLLGEVFPRQEITPYARFGDWFAWLCVGVALVAVLCAEPASGRLRQPL